MSKVPVMEIFGPTIQGEGMVTGQKTMFVRTAGCDFSCSWCDSSFTWDGSGKHLVKHMQAEEIWNELKAIGGNRFSFVTISGGNPALLKNLNLLINLLKENNIKIGLETQGSIWQDWFYDIDELTLSPKPPSSNMVTNFNVLDLIISRLRSSIKSFSIKIVVFDEVDFEYARGVHQKYPDVPFFLQVGNEDSTTTDNMKLVSELLQKYEWLINKVLEDSEMNDVKVLPQLHTLVWGNKREV
ncbi:7-carboxy-7-deazaguanine synthase QueE [Peribacillus simplex]|uniref:7-carboxy-7-deazaguanine synthase QueE n=1 Tax=Peribacillus simplex TaxID=1478 RepID=UPI0011A9D94D|nr:7-carboxy-7-deazaguanine synthase QueE [Peribacillus simplex]